MTLMIGLNCGIQVSSPQGPHGYDLLSDVWTLNFAMVKIKRVKQLKTKS